MAETLATLISAIERVLLDQPRLLGTASGQEVESAVREALERYSGDAPRESVVDIAGSGTYDLALPAEFLAGQSRIVRIEYPAGERHPRYLEPDDWVLYRTASTSVLRLLAHTPATGETVRLTYTAAHTIDGLDGASATTIPPQHTQAFVLLATARCLARLANRFLHEQESTLALDAVERGSKVDQARRLARDLESDYRNQVGVSLGEAPALARLDWDTTIAGSGLGRLTHPRRRV